jgi:RsiW-degrading membrane proteinase PrsW (M82 family)
MLPFILIYVSCIVLPPFFWYLMVRRVEGREPQAVKLAVIVFGLGIGAAVMAIWVNGFVSYLVDPVVVDSFDLFLFPDGEVSIWSSILAGPVEESLKLFLLYEVVYRRSEFKHIRHGVFYALICALGFSFIENSIYLINAASEGDSYLTLTIGVVRAVGSTMIHIGAGVMAGWFVGMSKWGTKPRMVYIFIGLLCAIVFHSLSNYLIVSTPFGIIIVTLMAMLIVYFVFRKVRIERLSEA